MTESVIPLRIVDDRLRAIEDQIKALVSERDMLLALKRQAVAIDTANRPEARPQIRPQSTLTDTVVEFVADVPGLTSGQIADAFEQSGLIVGGSDPRKTVLTTVGALVQKGRLRKDPKSGGHFVM